ncbi:MAG TPA: hypothetical protein VGC73_02410 [Pyrinomonadaceae bacterium]|jgi:hypothetical protein
MCGLVHRLGFVVLGTLVLLASARPTDAQRHRDPCRLLTDAEVCAIQGHAPAQKIPSEQPAGSFRFTQCLYRTTEFSSSVSVALGIPLTTDSKRSGARQYWQTQFKGDERAESGEEKEKPPKRLGGLGDEAFWVGDPVTGALYVLKGDAFLRVSVGGPSDQAEKIKRARALASYALKRLDTTAPRSRR